MRYRHLRRTTIAVLATVAILLLVALGVERLLTSAGVRTAAARWLSQRLTGTTGAELKVESLDWGLLPPRVIVRGLNVQRAGLSIRADRVSVNLVGVSLAKRTLELGAVTASGVHVRMHGLRPKQRASRPWLKLRIRHLDLDDIDIEGSDLPGGLAVGLANLRMAWTEVRGRSQGFAAADRVTLRLPGLTPIAASLKTRFSIDEEITAPHWSLLGEGFNFTGHGSLRGRRVRLGWRGNLSLAAVDRLIGDQKLLGGSCALSGDLDSSRRDLLRVDVRSAGVTAAGFPVQALAGRIALAKDSLHATLENGRIFGGRVSGTYRLEQLGPPFSHRIRLTGDGVELAAFLRHLGVPDAGLAGRSGFEISLAWDGAHIRAGHGVANAEMLAGEGPLPVAGNLEVRLDGDGLLRFSAPRLQVGAATVRWEGPLALGTWEPAWSVRATPADVSELAQLVNGWVRATVIPPELAGKGDAQLSLAGPWNNLNVSFRLEAAPLLLPPLRLERVVVAASIADGKLTVNRAAYRIGGGGGTVEGFLTWAPEAGRDQIDLTWSGHALPLTKIAGWFGAGGQVSGLLAFTGRLRGPFDGPHGSWALGFQRARVGPQSLGSGSASVDLTAGTFRMQGLTCDLGLEGGAAWDVSEESLDGDFRWRGISPAAFGGTAVRLLGTSLTGETSFHWVFGRELTGTLLTRSPQSSLAATLGTDRLDATLQLIGVGRAETHLARHDGASFTGPAEIEVDSIAALNRRVLGLSPGEAVLDGSGHARLDVSWSGNGLPGIDGEVDRLDLRLGKTTGHLVEPARVSLGENGFKLHGLWLKGTAQRELFVRLQVGPDGALSGHLTGNSDARLLQFFFPDWEPAGRVRGVLELLGTLDRPRFEGLAQVNDASFRIPDSQMIVSGLDGTILLSPGWISLDGTTFRLLDGRGTAGGRILLKDHGIELALAGNIHGAQFPLFPGLSPRLSGSWTLRGPPQELALGGDLTVDRTLLRRNDTLAEILYDWFGKTRPTTGSNLPRLDLFVQADHTIEARNAFLRMVGSGSLHITGTPRAPGMVGKIEIAEGGEFNFQGVQYELDRCVITFADPSQIAPHVDIQARATVDVYDVMVTLVGTGDRMIPTFTSDPPLASEDIIALLASGRRAATEAGGGPGMSLAGSLLSKSLSRAFERRARSLLAVDQVRLDPFAESSAGNATARVTVVKQLKPRWVVALESNLSANREEVIFSRWTLAPQVFLEATRERDGSLAIDLKLRRRY